MKKVTLTEAATINANGNHINGNSKPVICIDTGEVFASGMDAAEHLGVHWTAMSNHCRGNTKSIKGKRYCYVKDLAQNMDLV